MKRLIAILLLTFLVANNEVDAQTTGTCDTGVAAAELDVAGVRARVFNTGGLFFQGGGLGEYEVPKGSGAHSVFASNIWVGGMVNGELRISAATYADREFWPGPLDSEANPPPDCSIYDRIWKVSDADIRTYESTGVATQDMKDWPADLGAPVFDGDGNPDNYDLAAGDRPYVYGDQTAWWIMNDVGNQHSRTDSPPMGLEIRAAAFAADGPPGTWLPTATFYRYELAYRGTTPIDSMYFGMWVDVDVGNSADDYVGSDSLLGLGFGYNGDDTDEGESGYGSSPPAVGYIFAKGPQAESDGIDNDGDGATDEDGEARRATSFVFYSGDATVQGDPRSGPDYYSYLVPTWLDGQAITFGGNGRSFSETPVRFMFSGNPPDFWSEENMDGEGLTTPPSDRRFVIATGPFRMETGQSEEIVVAILWARGTDRLDSVVLLKAFTSIAYDAVAGVMEFDATATSLTEPVGAGVFEDPVGLGHYPNPVIGRATITVELATRAVARLVLYDVLGREVRVLFEGELRPGTHRVALDATSLPAGVYYYRWEAGAAAPTRALVLAP